MRIGLFLLIIIPSLFSCSKYQYLKLSSDNMPQSQTNEFVAENDSFRVVYKFHGLKGPVQIAIVNKSATSLQVDWNKSFFIRKNKSQPLFTPSKKRKAKKLEREESYRAIYTQNEMITRQQSLELVFLQRSINKVSLELFPKSFVKKIGGQNRQKEVVSLPHSSKKIKRAVFTRKSSPLDFRLYLTLSVRKDAEQIIILDNSFYISELITTRIAPHNIPDEADMIVIQKPTLTGAVIGTTGTIVVAAAVLLLKGWFDTWESDD